MAKTNRNSPYSGSRPGSGKVGGGGKGPFASALQRGRNQNPGKIPARSGKNTSGTAGAGSGADLKGGKAPSGRPLKVG